MNNYYSSNYNCELWTEYLTLKYSLSSNLAVLSFTKDCSLFNVFLWQLKEVEDCKRKEREQQNKQAEKSNESTPVKKVIGSQKLIMFMNIVVRLLTFWPSEHSGQASDL